MEPFPGTHIHGKPYTAVQIEWFRKYYPTTPTRDIVEATGLSRTAIVSTASYFGIRKDKDFVRSNVSTFFKDYYSRRTEEQKREQLSKQSVSIRRTIAHERRRMELGLEQQTRLSLPLPFTRAQTNRRYKLKNLGYILGDFREKYGERYCIYYDEETERDLLAEKSAMNVGFRFERLPKVNSKK